MVIKSQTAPIETPAGGRQTGDARAFFDLEEARRNWERLAQIAPASPYQSFRFASAWSETIGRAQGATPYIVLLRVNDAPYALLPLTITQCGPLRVARFVGGRQSNLNLPLIDPALAAPRLDALLQNAAGRDGPDLFDLANMPRRLGGRDNPLAAPHAQPSPSFAYGLSLPDTLDDLAARFSKDARKKLRNKESRLKARGGVRYEHCVRGPRAEEILAALITQKSARFDRMGLRGFFDAPMRAFLTKLVAEDTLELHALCVGARIVATYAGLASGGRFSTMFNSFEMDEDIARSSPADLLLHAVLRDLVARGMTQFDLGVGEARYKSAVCDETIELCDLIVPVSAKGRIAAPLFSLARTAKRRVKQTPALMRLVARARAIGGRL